LFNLVKFFGDVRLRWGLCLTAVENFILSNVLFKSLLS